MNYRALAKRLGLSIFAGATDAQVKALVCKHLKVPETADASVMRAAASKAGVTADYLVLARAIPEAARAAANGADYELLIYGDIGENWYGEGVVGADVARALQGLVAQHILVRISSYGGAVKDGIEIHNALRAHGARITTRIESVAASIASVIAEAGDEVQAYANTLFMAHAPWTIVAGNAQTMREAADMLDAHAKIIAASYARKTGRTADQEMAAVLDGRDHWFTAEEAVTALYVDTVLEGVASEDPAAASLIERPADGARRRWVDSAASASASAAFAAAHRSRVSAAVPPPAASRPNHSLEVSMLRALAKRLGINVTDDMTDDAVRSAICIKLSLAATATDDEIVAAASNGQAGTSAHTRPAPAAGAELTRDQEIDQILVVATHGITDAADLRRLQTVAKKAKLTVATTLDQVREQMIAALGNSAEPAAGNHVSVTAGADQRDKIVDAAGDAIVARAGINGPGNKPVNLTGNTFRSHTLADLARGSLERAGVNTRNMGRNEVIAAVLAPRNHGAHTTSDFPLLLENALNKSILAGAAVAASTWRRFCKVGSLSDFRPHKWYRPGSVSDFQGVNQAGEYKSLSLGDAERESITGASKGGILSITFEMLVNDDLGAFNNLAFGIGQAGERTIDKDVFALFALNGGDGPTLGDGKALFHADHNNDTAVSATVNTAAVDAGRVLMAKQTNVGGNDYLDIRPDRWLGAVDLGGQVRQVNTSEYEVGAANKNNTVPNYVRGIFADIIDTPRISSTAPWYQLASPDVEPVFAVAFLDGQQAIQLAMEENFTTRGYSWRASRDYGVAGVGYRGIVRTKRS